MTAKLNWKQSTNFVFMLEQFQIVKYPQSPCWNLTPDTDISSLKTFQEFDKEVISEHGER